MTDREDVRVPTTPAPLMSREEWLRFHAARAPKITREQWRKTRLILLELGNEEH